MANDNLNFSSRDNVEGVDQQFVRRWSPRAYLPDPVTQGELEIIFDAVRWSPSCFNEQPWLFYTSTATTHDTFVNLLVEGNRSWAKSAPLIGFVLAAKNFARNDKENYHASFDSGAAWMALNLQANKLGLYAHGMGGIDYDAVYDSLNIDCNTHQLICGFTLGRLDLSGDEEITARKPLAEIWRSFS